MLFTQKEDIEDKIVRYLLMEKQTAKTILSYLKDESNCSYTIQALYVVLRRLIKAEVVVKTGKYYLLNKEWQAIVCSHFQNQEMIELEEGESITYVLASLIHYDLQWKNVILPLHESFPAFPVFFYNYHYIWLHLSDSRKKSEQAYFSSFLKNKNYAFSLIGSSNNRDLEIKKKLQNKFVQWSTGIEYFPKTDCITVFENYIITTRLSKNLTEKLENLYTSKASIFDLEFKKIGKENNKIKLIIEKNEAKAKKNT
ncbi:MAG: hypothetical protein ACI9AR_000066 [Flavobacteriaceae bacterium]|jgi:hypothetical protein